MTQHNLAPPNPDLTPYQVDHLILLVGGNPLPNYVAARLLAKPGSTLYLVHTPEVAKIADRIATCLALPPENAAHGSNFATVKFIQVDGENPSDIFDKVHACVHDIPHRQTLGINYTSGNRPMSVHAYDAVAQSRSTAVFSYLDASKLEVLIHDGGRTSYRFRADKRLNMRLPTLLALQGLETNPNSKPPSSTTNQSGLATALAELHRTDTGSKLWFDWRRNGSVNWTKLPVGKPGLEIVEAAIEHMSAGNPTPESVAKALGYTNLTSTTEWWKGKWLEDFVLTQLQMAIASRMDTKLSQNSFRSVK